jgi:hypothetical protein
MCPLSDRPLTFATTTSANSGLMPCSKKRHYSITSSANAPAGEKGVATDKKRIVAFAHKRYESRIDLARIAGVEGLNLQPDGASRGRRVSQCGLGTHGIGRIDEHANVNRSGH